MLFLKAILDDDKSVSTLETNLFLTVTEIQVASIAVLEINVGRRERTNSYYYFLGSLWYNVHKDNTIKLPLLTSVPVLDCGTVACSWTLSCRLDCHAEKIFLLCILFFCYIYTHTFTYVQTPHLSKSTNQPIPTPTPHTEKDRERKRARKNVEWNLSPLFQNFIQAAALK